MSESGNPPQDPYGQPPSGEPQDPYGSSQPPQPPPSSNPYGEQPPGAPQYGAPQYGAPQYGDAQTGDAQYGAPQYGQPDQSGYGQVPPGGARPYSIGDAFNYGWTKFQANVGPIILAVLAIVAVTIVVQIIGTVVSGALASGGTATVEYNPDTGVFETSGGSSGLLGASFFVSMLFGFISMALSLIIQAGIIKASLGITYGRPVDLKEMFSGLNYLQIVITALIIGAATFVGLLLCVLPGLAVMFFTWFALYFVIDKDLPAVEAIKASVSFVNKNVGTLIGFFLAALLAYFVGALLCGLGLLVAIPVVVIAQAYTYRSLQGEAVAP